MVVGPAIGAILLAVAPDAVAFLVNASTFAASAALISTMRRRAAPAGTRQVESMRSELMHGLHTARTTSFVVPLFAVVAMAELTYGARPFSSSCTPRAGSTPAPPATATCWLSPGWVGC